MSLKFQKLSGLVLCFLIALPAWFLGQSFPLVGAPVFAIFLGMLLAIFYKNREHTEAGIAFTSKYILQFAVVLLGFGLNFVTGFNSRQNILTHYRSND